MSKFAHVSNDVRKLATAEITIEGIAGMRPVLTMRPATEANTKYLNALLKRQRRGRARRLSQVDVSTLKQNRDDDRELFAEHCVVGWDPATVVDANGNSVHFSKQDCLDLFRALPDHIFDDFRAEVSDPVTFVEAEDPADVEAQAGN